MHSPAQVQRCWSNDISGLLCHINCLEMLRLLVDYSSDISVGPKASVQTFRWAEPQWRFSSSTQNIGPAPNIFSIAFSNNRNILFSPFVFFISSIGLKWVLFMPLYDTCDYKIGPVCSGFWAYLQEEEVAHWRDLCPLTSSTPTTTACSRWSNTWVFHWGSTSQSFFPFLSSLI